MLAPIADIKILFIFGCHACAVHPVEPWLHVVAAGEGHDHMILTFLILPPLQQDS